MKKVIMITGAVSLTVAIIFSILYAPKKASSIYDFAMGSSVQVTVYGGKDKNLKANSAIKKVKDLDSKMLSHTLATSQVFNLNKNKSGTFDDEFVMYLKNCLDMAKDCDGFTLLSGGLKNLWKIEDGGYVPTNEELKNIMPQISNDNLKIKGNKITLLNNSILDLGALGKGTACQTAIDDLSENGVKNALCTVGGTVGVIGSPQGNKEFEIGVRNPFGEKDEYVGKINITDCFISTSGNYEKYFIKDDVKYSHIFDAKTGMPCRNNMVSVTAISDNGTVSDFLSTAIYILGETKGILLAEKYNAQIIIIKDDKSIFVSDGLKELFSLTDDTFMIL